MLSSSLSQNEYHEATKHSLISVQLDPNYVDARTQPAAFKTYNSGANSHYQVALQQAGIVGQRLYLAATALNLGCSGIGAFYDNATQTFLQSDRSVLYAIAIGQTQPHS